MNLAILIISFWVEAIFHPTQPNALYSREDDVRLQIKAKIFVQLFYDILLFFESNIGSENWTLNYTELTSL